MKHMLMDAKLEELVKQIGKLAEDIDLLAMSPDCADPEALAHAASQLRSAAGLIIKSKKRRK